MELNFQSDTGPIDGIIMFGTMVIPANSNRLIEENPIRKGTAGGVTIFAGGTVSDAGQPPEY